MIRLVEADTSTKNSTENNAEQTTFQLDLNPNLPDVQAHFPNQMLIPAYMQISWIEKSYALINKESIISEFKNIKFLKKIEPTGACEINITIKANALNKFTITKEGILVTSGNFIAPHLPS